MNSLTTEFIFALAQKMLLNWYNCKCINNVESNVLKIKFCLLNVYIKAVSNFYKLLSCSCDIAYVICYNKNPDLSETKTRPSTKKMWSRPRRDQDLPKMVLRPVSRPALYTATLVKSCVFAFVFTFVFVGVMETIKNFSSLVKS